jgi:type IX secretion system PorP/SprF family membrane protein
MINFFVQQNCCIIADYKKFNCNLRMRRSLLVFIYLVTFSSLSTGVLNAQDAEFTQFYANPLYLNPAFAGTMRCPRLVMAYRNQWPSLTGNFVTTSASYDQQVRLLQGGVGVIVVNDRAAQGTLNTTSLGGIYSYQQTISKKVSLKAALQATYFQKTLDWSQLTFGDMIDPRKGFIYQTQDLQRGGNVKALDFSAGVLGFSEKFYGGVAVHHLNEPNESLVLATSRLPMKFTFHAGAVLPIEKRSRDSDAKISPNILYRRQGEFKQMCLGTYVSKGPLVLGVWFRGLLFGEKYRDAFIATLGLQTDMIRVGYSYDVTISELTPATGGSHEVSLGINFECKSKKKKMRTVACPSF